jgi:NitT/TauT family transport system permease protein
MNDVLRSSGIYFGRLMRPLLHMKLRIPGLSRISLGRIGLVIVCGIAWQYMSDANLIRPLFFGSPLGIIDRLYQGLFVQRTLLFDISWTLSATLIAFILGSLGGIGCGLLFAVYPAVGRFFDPFITALNALPRIALAPLFILWFGLGLPAKIAVGVSLSIVIMLSSTIAGMRSVDPDLLMLARTLGALSSQIFFRITLPSAIPTIFSGLRLGLIYSLLGVVSAEILGSVNGLGVQLTQSAGMFDTNGVFAILVILALLGTALTWAMNVVEVWLLRWR